MGPVSAGQKKREMEENGEVNMDIVSLFVLALGLSMDAFAVSVSNSLCFAGLARSQAVATSATFGIFQGLMPLIGYFAGRVFAGHISAVDHWVAFALLGFIGGKMLIDALKEMREPEACGAEKRFTFRLMLVQAVATSIDALAVGVSLAALEVNIAMAVCFIAVVTCCCCLAAHAIGRRCGQRLGPRAQLLGGFILVGLGLKILLEHLAG